jgi:hypothetical protein
MKRVREVINKATKDIRVILEEKTEDKS